MQFRRAPVPRTGRKPEWRWHHFYKYPRTSQERRQAAACPDFVRPRRRGNYLPHSFDDVPRGDLKDRSWKRNKKRLRQWMR